MSIIKSENEKYSHWKKIVIGDIYAYVIYNIGLTQLKENY